MQVLCEALQYQQGRGELQVYLAEFVAAGAPGCSLLLKREGVAACAPAPQRHRAIAATATLQDALRGECIVEFPRFLVRLAASSEVSGQ